MTQTSIRGVTLVELLIAVLISGIAFFALTVPFVAERTNWGEGQRQTEAQRDAEVALRAVERAARWGRQHFPAVGPSSTMQFIIPACAGPFGGFGSVTFQGGPSFSNQFQMIDSCNGSAVVTLIDGVRSQVTNLAFTGITSKEVRIQLTVAHQLRAGAGQRQSTETLQTEVFLRNAP